MQSDCTTVDQLIAEIMDSTSGCQQVAVEKLRQLCAQSYEAYAYLFVRMLNESLPSYAEGRLRDVLMTMRTRAHVFNEYRRLNYTSNSGRDFLGDIPRRS